MTYIRLIKLLWTGFFGGLIGIPVLVIAIYYNWFNWFGGMPDLKVLENPKSELASEIYSADSVLLGKYYRSSSNRTRVEFDSLSINLINALTATEDVRFQEHSGIDLRSIMRVVFGLVTFNPQGGGSTLSQQLARNLFKTREELHDGLLCQLPILGTVIVKTKEWILAVKIERSYTKNEIMTMYLNTVDFGGNSFGIKVAAKTFFKVEPNQLSIAQAAILVGVLKSPTLYSPILNPDNAMRRRSTVFEQMEKYGYLTPEQRDSLNQLPLGVDGFMVDNHNTGLATYFRAELVKDMRKWCAEHKKPNGEPYDLYADGLRIYTTIDSRMQAYAEEAMREHMKDQQKKFFDHWKGKNPWIDDEYREIPEFLDRMVRRTERYQNLKKQYDDEDSVQYYLNKPVKMRVFTWDTDNNEKDTVLSPVDSVRYYKHFLHMGMMAMDPQTGEIKAWVGGINHKYFKFDNVRQGMRQPGSTFKPLVYATAIDQKKFDPCFKIVDAPITFTLDDGTTWTPKNSEEYTGNTYTLRQAMALSKNTAAVYLMKELGPDRVADYAENNFGIGYLREKYGPKPPIERVYSLALGTSNVTVFEMVAAYGVFANHGVWTEPIYISRIEDKDGKVLETFVPKTIEALSEEVAYTMTYMLRGSNEERGGTSMGLRRHKFMSEIQLGGKTGTTSNYSDAWFMGVAKTLVAGLWCGAEDNVVHFRSMTYGQGAKQAMPAFGLFMDKVYADPRLPYYALKGEKGRFDKPAGFNTEFDCGAYDRALQNAGDSLNRFFIPNTIDEDEFMN